MRNSELNAGITVVDSAGNGIGSSKVAAKQVRVCYFHYMCAQSAVV